MPTEPNRSHNNRIDSRRTPKLESEDLLWGPPPKLIYDREEKNSSNHSDQALKVKTAPKCDTTLRAERHWMRIRKKLSRLDPKKNHQLDYPTNYPKEVLQDHLPVSYPSYPSAPLLQIGARSIMWGIIHFGPWTSRFYLLKGTSRGKNFFSL